MIWAFDYNGQYHLLQVVGVIPLIAGVRQGLMAETAVAAADS